MNYIGFAVCFMGRVYLLAVYMNLYMMYLQVRQNF